MPQTTDRDYYQRRAFQELRATISADCIEAEKSHNGLTRLHLERCARCAADRSDECVECSLTNLCGAAF